MRPKDVRQCVDLVASHPVIAPRYAKARSDLHIAWLNLLDYEAKSAVVFEEVEGRSIRIWGVGVSVFVDDSFMRELKTPPFFWIGPELARRFAGGVAPVLSGKQMRESNSSGGLNLVTWEGFLLPEDAKRAEIYNKMIHAFLEEHRGFLWKEIIGAQADSAETLQKMIKSGGMFLNPDGRWGNSPEGCPQEIVSEPHVIGLTREIEILRPGSWVGSLFDYEPPQVGFNRSEQRLLVSALQGGTDEELSCELGISLSAVKKSWRAVYDRVTARLPELIPTDLHMGSWSQDRGKEKKQRLVAYLREHPEELRPVSRKLLSQFADKQISAST